MFTVLIPARYASTRLPGKPLADIGGVPMVVRVAQNAAKSGAARVVIACDDPRILDAARAHAVDAVLTRSDHLTGTDRLAEAAAALHLRDDEIVVNVQGDEPLLAPELVSEVAALLRARRPARGMRWTWTLRDDWPGPARRRGSAPARCAARRPAR